MAMTAHADLSRQLTLAAVAWRDNNDSEFGRFVENFADRSDQLEALLGAARLCWKSSVHDCAPQDILACLFRLDYACQPGLVECLQFIRSDIINGRAAIFCISEIQLLLQRYADSPYLESKEKIFLMDLFDVCIEPFLAPSAVEFSRCSVLLELVPVLFSVLSRTPKDSSSSLKRSTELKSMLEKLLTSEWRPGAEVIVLNMTTEINRFMKKSDSRRLQEKIVNVLSSISADDMAGVMRICLRFLEISRDPLWAHVFRIFYARIPAGFTSSVEAVLEQILYQMSAASWLIVDFIEETGLRHSQLIKQRRVSPLFTSSSGVWELNREPIVTHSDISLLLLILRSLEMTSTSVDSNLDRIPIHISEENLEEVFVCNRICRAVLSSLIYGSVPQVLWGKGFGDEVDTFNLHLTATNLIMHVLRCDEISKTSSASTVSSRTLYSSSSSIATSKSLNWTVVARGCQLVVCFTTFVNNANAITEFLNVSSIQSIEEIKSLLICCLTAVFEIVEPSRQAILSVVLRCAIRYSELYALKPVGAILNLSTMKNKSKKLDCLSLYVEIFKNWCIEFPHFLLQMSHTVISFVASVTALPIADVKSILLPVVSICNGNAELFGSILSCSRKLLLQRDFTRKVVGISLLCHLLISVNENWQKEAIQAILHSFSLPLCCRRFLYIHLFEVCETRDLSSSSIFKFEPCRDVKVILYKRLLTSMGYLFTEFINGDKSAAASKSYSRNILNFRKSVENFRALSGDKFSLSEDIVGVMRLGWLLESQLYPEICSVAIAHVAMKILKRDLETGTENVSHTCGTDSFSSYLLALIDTIDEGFPVDVATEEELKIDQKSHLAFCVGAVKAVICCLMSYTDIRNVSEAIIVLQAILDCLFQVAIVIGCADSFSSLDKFYTSSLSGSHLLQISDTDSETKSASSFFLRYPMAAMFHAIMDIFHAQSTFTRENETLHIPLSSVFGSMSQIATDLRNIIPYLSVSSSKLLYCFQNLMSMYLEAGAISKEPNFLESIEELAVAHTIYQMQRDPSFYRNHFTGQRKVTMALESRKRSIYNEDSDEDNSMESSNDEDDDNFSTCSTLKEFSIIFEANKSKTMSIVAINSLLGNFAKNLSFNLLQKLEKWDYIEIEQFKRISIDKSFKFKLNRFFKKIQSSARSMTRYSLFGLRIDILKAIKCCFSTMSLKHIPSDIDLVHLIKYFSDEFKETVRFGVSIDSLKVYIELIQILSYHLKAQACVIESATNWQEYVASKIQSGFLFLDGVPQSLILNLISLIVGLHDDRRFGIKKCNILIDSSTFQQSSKLIDAHTPGSSDISGNNDSLHVGCAEDLVQFKNVKISAVVLSEALRTTGKILMNVISEHSIMYLDDDRHFRKLLADAALIDFCPKTAEDICGMVFGGQTQFFSMHQKFCRAPVAELGRTILKVFEVNAECEAESEVKQVSMTEITDSAVAELKRKPKRTLTPDTLSSKYEFKISVLNPKLQNVYVFLASKYILSATKEIRILDKKLKLISKLLLKSASVSKKSKEDDSDYDSDLEHIWSDEENDPEKILGNIEDLDQNSVSDVGNVSSQDLDQNSVSDVGNVSSRCETPQVVIDKMSEILAGSRLLSRFRGSGLPVFEFFVFFLYSSTHTNFLTQISKWSSSLAHTKLVSVSSLQLLKFRMEKFELELMNLVSAISNISKHHVVPILTSIQDKANQILKVLCAQNCYDDVSVSKTRPSNSDSDSEVESVYAPKQKKTRLRSRNRVIDQWLSYEVGDDSYADLEDFLVE